jgi:hypothetical protein
MPSSDLNRAECDSDAIGMAFFFLVAFVLLLLLIFWPLTKQFVPGLADPPQIYGLGTVQETNFIGGFFIRTQVKTELKTVLLRDAIEIDTGTRVERRVTTLDDYLCVVGGDACYKVVSH